MRYETKLSCGHTIIFHPPEPHNGEIVWCSKCDKGSVVVDALPHLRVKCRNCRVNKVFGARKREALEYASMHLEKRPKHIVDIFDGENIEHEAIDRALAILIAQQLL